MLLKTHTCCVQDLKGFNDLYTAERSAGNFDDPYETHAQGGITPIETEVLVAMSVAQ